MTSGQITYDLRRLRLHGLIERIPRTFRYQVTDTGLRSAQFLTRVHDRLLRTGLAQLTDPRASRSLVARDGAGRPNVMRMGGLTFIPRRPTTPIAGRPRSQIG